MRADGAFGGEGDGGVELDFRSVVDHAGAGICVRDRSGRAVYANERLAAMLATTVDDVVGTASPCWVEESQRDGGVEVRLRRRDDGDAWALLSRSALDPASGSVLEILTDITDHKATADELARHAMRDALTGLPNRAVVIDHLVRATAAAQRVDRAVAVLFCDLDDFKAVNDTYGHHAGDCVLEQVAQRLGRAVRECDVVARIGGDEFVVLCEHLDDLDGAREVAERVLASLRLPFPLDDGAAAVSISASVGVAVGTDGSRDLLREADLALYRAKSGGRDSWVLFDEALHRAATARHQTTRELRRALSEHQLSLHYQPIATAVSGELVGVEALLRWEHPARGTLTAGQFLALLEGTDVGVEVGRWVLAEATRQAARWQADGHDLIVTVNVGARQFGHGDLVELVTGALDDSGLRPDGLCLELTETAVLDDLEVTAKVLGRLRDLGVRSALDDFGTGYSSMSYLSRLPLDLIKIDGSFVRGIVHEPSDSVIVRAANDLGRNLGLGVVAEGVEHRDQLGRLVHLEVPLVQGFLTGRPLGAEATTSLISTSGTSVEKLLAGVARVDGELPTKALDALDDGVGVIDPAGVLRWTNMAWNRHAAHLAPAMRSAIGTDYLGAVDRVIDLSDDRGRQAGREVGQALLDVLRRRRRRYQRNVTLPTADGSHRYRLRLSALDPGGVAVVFTPLDAGPDDVLDFPPVSGGA